MTKGGLDCGWSARVAHVERGKSRRGKRQRTGVSSFPVSLMRNKDALHSTEAGIVGTGGHEDLVGLNGSADVSVDPSKL